MKRKKAIGFVVLVAFILLCYVCCSWLTAKKDFDEAEEIAYRVIRAETYSFPDIVKTTYNPFTHVYTIYFFEERIGEVYAKVNMRSKDENGRLNQLHTSIQEYWRNKILNDSH